MMRNFTTKPFILAAVGVLLGASSSILPAFAQQSNETQTPVEKAPPADASSLLRQFQQARQNGDVKQSDGLARSLAQRGEEAVSAVLKNTPVQRDQIYLLGQIHSDSSTNALLEIANHDEKSARSSLGYLAGRPIPRPLSPQELQSWIARLQSNVGIAGSVANLLARCSFNDTATRAQPIIARFIKEIRSPERVGENGVSYLSPQVSSLNLFVAAFAHFDDPSIIDLLQQSLKSQANPTVIKWLTISTGMVGDASVAPQLKLIVAQEKDASLKTVALRAYSRAAKGDALPVLTKYVNDPTVTTQGHRGPYLGLQMVARSEITKLNTN